ncbi:MAG: ice-binding family protein, partial [Bacteroidetes bacterium]|nr:ice-binding family protein [Bacteroidota bacterium]
MKTHLINVLTAVAMLLMPLVNLAQAPDLGAASSFALFTSVGAFNNVGPTIVTGDIGTNAGAFTGFPPGSVTGQIHVADPTSSQAATDLGLAYSYLGGLTCNAVIGVTLGNNQILTPDVYCTGAATTLNGDLTLDAQGNPNALFIFKIDGAFTTGTYSNVLLINSASLCNVYWWITGAFSLGDYSVFRGNVISNGQIELLEGSTLLGRGLTKAGALLLHNNLVTIGSQPIAPTAITTQPTYAVPTGSITVTAPIGTGYSYSIGGAYQSSATFSNLIPNTYTVTVKNSEGCNSAGTNVTINAVPIAPATPLATLTQPTCLLPTGTIVVTSPLGATLEYSKDGINWQSSTTFGSLAPGFTYTIRVRDSAGDLSCVSSSVFVINAVPNAPAAPLANLTQPTCLLPTGTIVVISPLGVTLEYSKDGINWQSSTTFGSLAPGFTYTIRVRDSAGDLSCVSSSNFVINVVPNAPAAPLANLTQPTCLLPTGTIVVTSPLGVTLEYSKDGINWQSSTTFGSLAPGFTYTIRVRDSA